MLEDYKKKREFEKTPEPLPKAQTKREGFSFVVQLHDASHLHYDLRLELDGVLKSWAIPKGPSLDPKDKRLAMMVEDHPLDYQYFEGTIPPGNYGAGTVMIWDRGTYGPEKQSHEPFDEYVRGGLKEGKFSFNLYGRKLKGSFALFRFGSKENQWMLIKHSDRFASSEDVRSLNLSVKTGFSLPLINALDNLEITLTEKMKTPLPKRISPMLATFAEKPVEGKDWLFEIKWDGYRAISKLENGEVNLYSRNLQSFNAKFPEIAAELKKLNINAVIDGEVVALDEKGMPRFNLLQNIPPLNLPLSKGEQVGVVYYCFDLIYFEGYDLRSLPLMQRKQMLFRILPSNNPFIKYVDHVVGEGKRFYEQASKMGLEGIIGKKNGSTYQAGKRSSDWIKIKTAKRQEAVIGGYTAPRGSREGIGALVLGVYDDNKLHYIGHTGTGFDTKESIRLKNLLDKIMTNDSPFEPVPKTNSKVTWVEPKEVAEISFTEWTPDGKMRHPVYLGLREDKNPKEVCLDDVQIPIEGSDPKSIPISHREKIFWPEENYTKGDMIDYYEAISGTMLPYLRDRPMVMNRFPNGIKGLSFYQKNVKEKDLPPFVEIKEIISSSGKKTNYILGNNRETLLYMANLASIEINPWNSRIQHLEQPDYFVIDLDPLDVSFELVVEIAQIVKEILKLAHLEGYCKTSGATGLHIYVPLNAKYSYETVRSFAHVIADLVSKRCLKWASTERSPAKRAGKVYVDYLQNAFGQTLVAPYSLRPRPGAPVSTPLDWSEVNSSLKVLDYNMTTVPKRIKDKGDIWKPILECQNDLQEAFTQLEKISS